jgi:hypothetical protein
MCERKGAGIASFNSKPAIRITYEYWSSDDHDVSRSELTVLPSKVAVGAI